MEEQKAVEVVEDSRAEWVEPAVEDFDVESITLVTSGGTGVDLNGYS